MSKTQQNQPVLAIRIDADLRNAFRLYSLARGRSMTQQLVLILNELIKRDHATHPERYDND